VAAQLANQHAALGNIYAQAGALNEAIREYERATLLGPTFVDLRYRLARLLLEGGRTLEARDQLEKVVKDRPSLWTPRPRWAWLAISREMPPAPKKSGTTV
jgi:tetratricopeptide (TPR) repeat protein